MVVIDKIVSSLGQNIKKQTIERKNNYETKNEYCERPTKNGRFTE